jgi:flagellar basal-body rod modification protein FlgD
MSVELTSALPSNILTTKQYEDQQAKLFSQEEDLDRTAFLTLFTTQLKNQNPLDPMDNEAFVSQLAQFSSLEAMTGVRTSVENMAADSKSEKFLLGSSLLGKRIERVGSLATRVEGETVTTSGQLMTEAESGVFNVYDAKTSELVYSKELTNLAAGDIDFDWDGRNQEGEQTPGGQYKYELTIERNGVPSVVPLINKQMITAVSWDQTLEELKVEVEGKSVLSMAEVGRIEY